MRTLRGLYGAVVVCLMMYIIGPSAASGAATGTLRGRVFDRDSKDALPGAALQVAGTGLGVSTDLDGRYILHNVPAGSQKIVVSYVGYRKVTIEAVIAEGQTLDRDIAMTAEAIEGETVVVTGQARGQMAAINQQLASNSIVNVVSADKMKELPDANLAESIGRLPGISLQRNAGEAYAVTVRGLSPKYNEVTIEGVPMSSTNYYDRTIDLSLLSDDLVRAVEVSKTLRPDQDADALGGTVNLTLKTAEPGLHYSVSGNGGYTNLRDTYKNYKFAGSVSSRFLDDQFGIIAQGNIEEKQLPSDQFAGTYGQYTPANVSHLFYVNTLNATLTDQNQTRHRFGGSIILDYTSDFVDLKFFDVYDQKRDSSLSRTYTSNFQSNSFQYNIYASQTRTEQWTHSLSANFKFWGTELPVSVSYTRGIVTLPNQMEFDFWETNVPPVPASIAIYGDPATLINVQGVMDPTSVNTTLYDMKLTQQHLTDNSFDIKADWHVPFRLSDFFSGRLSAGGKVHGVTRTSDQEQVHDNLLWGGMIQNRKDLIAQIPYLAGSDPNLQAGIQAAPWIDHGYKRTSILGYPIGPGFNAGQLIDMQTYYYFGLQNQLRYWQNGQPDFDHNYTDIEHTAAAYIMGEFNLGSSLTVVPGARFEEETTDIRAYHIYLNGSNQNGLSGQTPALAQSLRNTPNWFPSVNAKYRLTDNIQFIGAAYKSVSLPSYGQISPLTEYDINGAITTNNPLLRPSTAWNFDFGTSYSSNDVGLVTVNLFYKEISDLIYSMQNFYPFYPYAISGAPADIYDRIPGVNSGYFDNGWAANTQHMALSTSIPMNDPEKAFLRGVELSWQTHLWYLPGVLSGIVLDVNAAFMSSSEQYPSFNLVRTGGTPIRPVYTLFYQTLQAALQDQPKATYNAILGWDYMGFSSRFSLRYQQKTVSSVDTQYGLVDPFTDNITIFDIALKQQILAGLSAFASATNVNGHIDNYYFEHPAIGTYAAGQLPTSKQTYGWAMRLGLTYNY